MVLAAVVCATTFKTTLLLSSDGKSIKVFIRNESAQSVTILDPDENRIQYDLKLVKRRRGREPDWIIACGPWPERKAETITLAPKELVEREYKLDVKREYAGSYIGTVQYQDDGEYKEEKFVPVGATRKYKLKLDVTPKGSYKIKSLK